MQRRKKRVIELWEHSGILWLSKEIKISEPLLSELLIKCRKKTLSVNLYRNIKIKKSSGGVRTISVPDPFLLKVQKAINKHLLCTSPSHSCAFGFSGGSIVDAIKPHLENKVMYSFDVVNAFGQISEKCLWHHVFTYSFSRPVSRVLLDLALWEEKLPQGSAMSPRLFDQAFYIIDARVALLAEKLGGKYTRYADNIFFSLPTAQFPTKLRSAVLRRMRMDGTRIKCHKFSVRKLDRGAVRILGLNIVNGKVTATRDYKRNLRLALHHVQYLIDHELPYYAEWSNLKGRMAFGSIGSLPNSLVKSYLALEEKVLGLEY